MFLKAILTTINIVLAYTRCNFTESPIVNQIKENNLFDLDVTKTLYIPLVFNINHVYASSTGKIPVKSIETMVEILNQAYAGNLSYGEKVDSKIRFFIHGISYWERKDNLFYGECETPEVPRLIRSEQLYRYSFVLNVFTCNMHKYLGFATSPFGGIGMNGVVINYHTFPGLPTTYSHFGRGYTLVHEIGHVFGLIHTFQGGCNGVDAYDTAPEAEPYFGTCDPANPVYRDTCPGDNLTDPITNFMDYSDDYCVNQFSLNQTGIMRYTIANELSFLYEQQFILNCHTDGKMGNAHKYGLCENLQCNHSKTPNGIYSPTGWCYIRGTRNKWGSCSCSYPGDVKVSELCSQVMTWPEAVKFCATRDQLVCSYEELPLTELQCFSKQLWVNKKMTFYKNKLVRTRNRRNSFLCC